jgi:hypothetical protein
MKKYLLLPVLFCLVLQGCLKDKITKTYSILVPVYKSKTEVYANIKSNIPRDIASPGKLFIIGNYIFLNEIDKGVHVIDNSNPANPVVKTFIDIPGNLDIAVKGNTLFADLYGDLVVVDIANPLDAKFVKYIPHVFPERIYGNGFTGDSSRVIVDWIKKDTTVRINNSGIYYDMLLVSSLSQAGSGPRGQGSSGIGTGPVGIAGSMARFSIVNDYLYTVDNSKLRSFNIADTRNPVSTSTRQLGWNIETIYPFSNKLFIGSMTGMFIFDISNPAAPVAQGQFTHFRSCDPVVADNSYAYVTLRGGTACGGFTNQLDVVNISNLQSPSLAKTYPLTNPHGLAKDNNLLFICDGKDGLKMYDATDPLNISLKKTVTGIETYDAIAWNNNLLVVAKDGLYQYDYSNPATLVQKSKLAVKK